MASRSVCMRRGRAAPRPTARWWASSRRAPRATTRRSPRERGARSKEGLREAKRDPGVVSGQRGIGRGLAAILPETGPDEPDYREVPTNLIRPNPNQPRRRIEPDSISALAESIAEAGVIQPLIVRPLPDGRYELIAGERRWRAAREAGLGAVPALIRDEDEARRMQT